MIRFLPEEGISDLEFREGRRVTLDEVSRAAGIHRTTLSKIADKKGCNCATDNLDKLCEFFGCRIEELAEYLPEQPDPSAQDPAWDDPAAAACSFPLGSMEPPRTLLSWIGAADLRASTGEAGANEGPISQAAMALAPPRILLLSDYASTAKLGLRAMAAGQNARSDRPSVR
jgi:putative transcriptional regulator